MKTASIAAIALAAAALGASASGWIVAHGVDGQRNGVVPTNIGYQGPASVALGDIAGAAAPGGAIDMPNPYGTSPQAIADGKRLYQAMNCAGCHGYDGGGNMGPALNDSYWRYGGAPAQIYKTIYEGRPQGMPAWGHALPADQLWKITAYVSSLGGGVAPKDAVAALRGDRPPSTDVKSQPNAAEGGSAIEGQ
ncbi:c-type cytochrome [Sphingomonas sp. AR_OL41]|uniref:c-type cytochrome n=1 Tax=Sphingomonas sp. AR_OL41 TaxID=3042729 RepID=UPI002480174F|nr:c-type cytochrome [Sphingomonas sp. AR_OL41]MDH7974205.1 c-type cytochrome [Sphingomonas sp. AR_OL41]